MFSKNKGVQELLKVSEELRDIGAAMCLLGWDQETYMPPKGSDIRAKQLATLAGIYHEKLISVPKSKFKIKSKNKYDIALVREMEREYEKAVKIPTKLVKQITEAISRGVENWKKAKKAAKFSLFEKYLEEIVALKIKAAKLLQKDLPAGRQVYDVMLDDFELGLTQAEVERVFNKLKTDLTNLAWILADKTKGADKVLAGKKYDIDEQRKFGLKVVADMGFDLEAGRQDKSTHPFEESLGIQDVRMTTWENDRDLRPMLFATIHETGHGLYEQGVDLKLERTHLAGGTGLAMHESQSRLWENMVGRSEWFWKKYFPQLKLVLRLAQDKQEFVRAINIVRPSLIRVEADEVTYGLHVIIRFEIEKDLIAGKIKVKDLPKIWNQKYKEYLGIVPKNDREGVLQDIHWAHGSIGYFPTYLFGTLTAAQIFNTAKRQMDVTDLKKLREWLRRNIHQYGKLYTSAELLKKVTGESLNPEYFVEYLKEKFEKLYK